MIPYISIIGKSDSGKTTFLEKLIGVLVGRGLVIATAKHHTHPIEIDTPGKDSWRHAQAGAQVTMVSSPMQYSVIHHVSEEATLEKLVLEAEAAGVDLMITEGFKKAGSDRIELSRMARSETPVSSVDEIIGLITDNQVVAEKYAKTIPTFGLEDVEPVADFIMARYNLFRNE